MVLTQDGLKIKIIIPVEAFFFNYQNVRIGEIN